MSAKAKRRSVWAIWSIVLVGIAVLVLWDITSTVAQKQSQFIIGSLNELSSKQNSIVGICQSNDPDLGGLQAPLDATLTYEQVDSITKLAIQRAGGFGPVIEANDWVLIKVNMITVPYVPGNWTWSKQGTCTDLRVGKSVIEQLIELDIPLHITVAEGGTWRKLGEPNCPPSQTEDGWTVHWSHYGNLSWEDMTAELDTFPLVTVDYMDLNYSSQSPYTERPVPGGGYSQSSYYIPDAIVNCNKLIAIPAMKTHGLARVTLSNKLYVGISPAEVYNQDYWNHMGLPHSGAEPDQIEKTIVDLMSYHPPDFVVIPCFWGIEGAGPWKAGEGKSLKGTSIKRNLVIAGRDPVSVDAATVTAMGRNPYDIETLYLANQKGYGNWRLDKIDVAGPSLEEVAYDWAMPSVRGLGYYQGRGNRTWLINGSYSGIDLDYDYLGGEAGVSPVEGDSSGGLEWTAVGWTNMRDYCDLAAYFGSPSNCISYAFTRIIADSAQTAYLRLGADDGIKVWLNGVIEYQNNNTGSWSMIQNYPGVQINLQEGVNDLLVKVKNEGGAYGFSLYISESDGDTPLGIKYSILSPVAPVVELEYPANGASTTNDSMELAATVTDPDEDSMTVWIYGDISDASDLFYVQENVASGSYITYNWTAPVLTADTSTIGLWHFDEGSGDTVYDASPNGNHGTIFDATWTVGRFGSALHFDGVDDYVRVLNSPSLNPTSAISIELWTYREDNRSWSKMLSKPYGLGAWPAPLYVTYGLAMQTRGSDVGNLIEFPISINGQPIGMAPEGNSYGAVPLFEWHYIAVTFDGQYHRIYIDGQLDREEYTPGTIDSGYTPGSDLFIGSAQPDLSVGGYYLGSLDEVRISNRTRTDQEIADAYRLGVGSYAWKVKASDGANETTSETRYFSVLSPTPDTLPPVITLNRPPNDSTTTSSFMELSTTVSDPDGSPMTLWIYGDQNPNPTNLVYQESSLSSPSTVTYVWGSLPQELEVDTNTAGLWHFNENSGTTASDETANNNDGTISGATWTTGRFGFALSFDGVDDYVQMSDAASLDITGDLTLEAWIKPDALTADHAIITKRDAGGTCNYQMYLNSDNEGLSFYAGGATEYQSSLIPTVGQWSYVAIVRSGTTLDFYLDDQTVQMSGPATLTANNQPLQIGSRSVGSLPEAFDGTMDEVRITNRALTPQEIAANYSSELAGGRYYWNGIVSDGVNEDTSETRYFDVVAPGPDTLPPVITLNSPDSASATTADSAILSATVDDPEGNPMTVWFYGDQNPDPTTLLYQESDVSDPSTVTYLWGSLPQELQVDVNTSGLWHFNENTGTTAYDETANDNDGTISGAAWTTGRFGSALSFDGSNDYVQVADASSLDITGDLTLEAWIKPDALTGSISIVTKRDAGGTCNYQMYLNGTTQGLSFYAGGGTEYRSTLVPTVGQWSYVAIVRSSTTLDFYLNNQTAQMAGPTSLTTNSQPVQIGSRSVGTIPEAFDGTMDEVRISNRALTPEEIAGNYSSELAEGRYYWKVAASDGSNADTSQVWFFDVVAPPPDTLPPVITLNSPDSASSITADSAELSATVDDPEGNPMTVWFYGDQNPDPTTLLSQESDVSDPSTVTYLWGGSPQELEVDTNTAGLWHFNENTGTTASDETANNNDGTISGATWTTGRFGSGLSFDGVDDYVQMSDAASLDITDWLTIEAWVKFESIQSDWRVIVGKVNTTLAQSNYHLSKSNTNTIHFGFNDGTWHTYSSALTVSAGQWYYLAATYSDPNDTVRIYVNGVLDTAATCSFSLLTNDLPLRIGRNNNDQEALNATIDEVRISNRALSPEEIAANYSSELAEGRYYWKVAASDGSNADTSQVWFFDVVGDTLPPVITLNSPDSASTTTADSAILSATVDDPEGYSMTVWFYGDQNPDPTTLLYQESDVSDPSTVTYLWGSLPQELQVDVNTSGLWHFNENTGTTAYDETANDNDGTISGAAWTTGRFGSALSFDGSNDYVQVADASSLDITGDLTLEAWIKPDALTGSISIVTKRDAGGTCNYQMYLNGTTQGLSFYAGGGTEYRSTLVPTIGQWSYVAIVRSGTTLDFYLDDQTAQMSGPATLTANSQPVQIGSRSVGTIPEAFDGTMDEVRITNRALTPQEIAANYSSELAEGRYYWKVAASDGSNADTSQVWFFDAVAVGPPPDIPTLINPPDLALINDNTPTFDWSSTAGVGGDYTIQYALDAGFTTGVQTITDIPETTYTIPDPDSLSDATYYWHVQAFNSGGDSSGYQTTPFSFTVDAEIPDPPTDFTVEPGHEKCKLSWTNPTGDASFAGVEIRRNPWEIGAYPEYDDDYPTPIGYPADEIEGDLVYQGTAESFRDSSDTGTMPRNVYYYSIFSYDLVGNYSAATSAGQGRATDYWLGDVTGDGYVYYEDLTSFSNAFRTSPGEPGYDPEFDIGPTYSMSPKDIPTTDDVIDFEDLVIFAINFAAVSPNLKIAPVFADQDISGPLALSLVMPTTELEVGKEFKVQVLLRNNPGTVKSMHLVLPYDPSQLEFVRVDRSGKLKAASYPLFFDGRDMDRHVDVSLALLGGEVSIGGSGEIASIVFRLLEERDLSLSFSLIDLRDGENQKLSAGQEDAEYEATSQVPSTYELSQNYPNPYNPQTQIAYQLPQAGEVSLKIYNIRGELVRTLVAEHEPAGYHTVLWDGRNEYGREVSSGVYFYRMVAGDFSTTKKMVMIK